MTAATKEINYSTHTDTVTSLWYTSVVAHSECLNLCLETVIRACVSVFAYLFTGGSRRPKGTVRRENANVVLKRRQEKKADLEAAPRSVIHMNVYVCVCVYYEIKQIEVFDTLRKYVLDGAYIIKIMLF